MAPPEPPAISRVLDLPGLLAKKSHSLFGPPPDGHHRDYVSGAPLHFWRTTSNFEVDFIVGDHTAVEAKATAHVSADDLRGLRALAEEGALRRYLCVSLERRRREVDGIVILPYTEFLDGLWGGEWC